MQQWFNPSHPQTLQAAIILGYFAGVFSLLGGGLGLPVALALIAGAFGSANNKRWGFMLLAAASSFRAALIALAFVQVVVSPAFQSRFFIDLLLIANAMVFPTALAAAVLHPHSREYQKVWFE